MRRKNLLTVGRNRPFWESCCRAKKADSGHSYVRGMKDSGSVGSTDFIHHIHKGEVPRKKKMLKGHLPSVGDHQAYNVYEDTPVNFGALSTLGRNKPSWES